jgi:hypothetical protein
MRRNKLYAILAVACLAGYAWLLYSLYNADKPPSGFGICMFKTVTGVPCPSCGSTRAMLLLTKGEVRDSIMMNPFGLIVAALMVVIPLWIAYDLVFRKQTLFNFYKKAEVTARIKWIAALLIVLALANWYWNIHKNL